MWQEADSDEEWSECSSCDSDDDYNRYRASVAEQARREQERAEEMLMVRDKKLEQRRQMAIRFLGAEGEELPNDPNERGASDQQQGSASSSRRGSKEAEDRYHLGRTPQPALSSAPTADQLYQAQQVSKRDLMKIQISQILKQGSKKENSGSGSLKEIKRMQALMADSLQTVPLPKIKNPKVEAAERQVAQRSVTVGGAINALVFVVRLKRRLNRLTEQEREVEHAKRVVAIRKKKNEVVSKPVAGETLRSMRLSVSRKESELFKSLQGAVKQSSLRATRAKLRGPTQPRSSDERGGVSGDDTDTFGLRSAGGATLTVPNTAAAAAAGTHAARLTSLIPLPPSQSQAAGRVSTRADATYLTMNNKSGNGPSPLPPVGAVPALTEDQLAKAREIQEQTALAVEIEGNDAKTRTDAKRVGSGENLLLRADSQSSRGSLSQDGGEQGAVGTSPPPEAAVPVIVEDSGAGADQLSQYLFASNVDPPKSPKDGLQQTTTTRQLVRSPGGSRSNSRKQLSSSRNSQRRRSSASPSDGVAAGTGSNANATMSHGGTYQHPIAKTNHLFTLNPDWKDEPFVPVDERTHSLQTYTSQSKKSKLFEFTRMKIPTSLPEIVPRAGIGGSHHQTPRVGLLSGLGSAAGGGANTARAGTSSSNGLGGAAPAAASVLETPSHHQDKSSQQVRNKSLFKSTESSAKHHSALKNKNQQLAVGSGSQSARSSSTKKQLPSMQPQPPTATIGPNAQSYRQQHPRPSFTTTTTAGGSNTTTNNTTPRDTASSTPAGGSSRISTAESSLRSPNSRREGGKSSVKIMGEVPFPGSKSAHPPQVGTGENPLGGETSVSKKGADARGPGSGKKPTALPPLAKMDLGSQATFLTSTTTTPKTPGDHLPRPESENGATEQEEAAAQGNEGDRPRSRHDVVKERFKVAVAGVTTSLFNFNRWKSDQKTAQMRSDLDALSPEEKRNAERNARFRATALKMLATDIDGKDSDGTSSDVSLNAKKALGLHKKKDEELAGLRDPEFLECREAAKNYEQFLIHKQQEQCEFIDRSIDELSRLYEASQNFVMPRKRTAIISQSDAGKGFLECSRRAQASLHRDIGQHHHQNNLSYTVAWFQRLKTKVYRAMEPPFNEVDKLFSKFEPFFQQAKLTQANFWSVVDSYSKDDLYSLNLQFLLLRFCPPFKMSFTDVEKGLRQRGIRLIIDSDQTVERTKEINKMDEEDADRERAMARIEEVQRTNQVYYKTFHEGEVKAQLAILASREEREKKRQQQQENMMENAKGVPTGNIGAAPQGKKIERFGTSVNKVGSTGQWRHQSVSKTSGGEPSSATLRPTLSFAKIMKAAVDKEFDRQMASFEAKA